MDRGKQKIVELIPWLVAAYTVICMGAYFGNRLFMYFPDPTRIAPVEAGLENVEEIEIAVADGVTVATRPLTLRRVHDRTINIHLSRLGDRHRGLCGAVATHLECAKLFAIMRWQGSVKLMRTRQRSARSGLRQAAS